MRQTKDEKIGEVRKMKSYESPGPKDMAHNPMREGHHKLSGSLMDELREGNHMSEEEEEAAFDSEMENVHGVKKAQKKSPEDYTRIKDGVKQGPNKIKPLSKDQKY